MASGPTPSPDPTECRDRFPRHETARLVHRLPGYARLAWNLARDPAVTPASRAAVLAAAGYVVSPIDLVPGFIPVLGQLDDLLVLLAALRLALAGLDPEQRRAHLAAAGLSDAMLAEDARALGLAGAWIARRAGHLALRAGQRGAQVGVDTARRTAPVGVRGIRTMGSAAVAGTRRAGRTSLAAGRPGRGRAAAAGPVHGAPRRPPGCSGRRAGRTGSRRPDRTRHPWLERGCTSHGLGIPLRREMLRASQT